MSRFWRADRVFRCSVLILTSCLCSSSAPIAVAGIIVSDSFLDTEYVDGQGVFQKNGGTGWAGSWTSGASLKFDASGGLSLPNHDSSGGAAGIVDTGNASAERKMAVSGNTASTVYIGALIRLGEIGTPDAIIQVTDGGPLREFRIGTSGATDTKWSLYASDSVGSAVTQVTTANVTTDTTLLLTRIDYNVSGDLDLVRLFVNPLEASEPTTSDAEISTENLGSSLGTTEFFRVFFFGGNRGFIDEIRVADSFQEATSFSSSTSTPEPSSLLMMGIAVALASCWRIRRRHVAAKV